MSDQQKSSCFRTSIGGQALIEGILMRGVDKQAIAVRTPEQIVTKVEPLRLIRERYPILGLPLIRGVVTFVDSMAKGVSALMYSAELLPEDQQEEPGKFDQWIMKTFGSEKADKIIVWVAVALGIALSVGLFFLLPTALAGVVSPFLGSNLLRNLAEGLLRIAIFMLYLLACARMKDVARMFAYHGAEHKAIFCYEKGLPLTVENVRIQPRQHPRCGTSFLFVVMAISILVFSFLTWTNVWVRMATRLLLLPLVVALSYELNRWVGRHDNFLTRALSAPGRAIQNITTGEPDDGMIEVAIEALRLVIPEQSGADTW